MKKNFTLILCALCVSFAQAQEKGFTTSMDLGVQYKNEVYGAGYYLDFGYTIIDGLYVGAGPVATVGIYDSNISHFYYNVGGYGKIRYTAPLETSVKPYVDARAGYLHSLDTGSGAPFCIAGLGAQLTDRFYIGGYCSMSFPSTGAVSAAPMVAFGWIF